MLKGFLQVRSAQGGSGGRRGPGESCQSLLEVGGHVRGRIEGRWGLNEVARDGVWCGDVEDLESRHVVSSATLVVLERRCLIHALSLA